MTATLAELKAHMLVDGVNPDAAARAVLLHAGWKPGFIHGGVLDVEGIGSVNTRAVDLLSASGDAPRLVTSGSGKLHLLWSGASFECVALPVGQTLVAESSTVPAVGSFSLHAPGVLFCSPVDQCIFGVIEKPCTFCTFEMDGPIRRLSAEDYEAGLRKIRDVHPSLRSVALGGGTPTLADSGAKYFSELVRITRKCGLAVSVEMVPPPDPNQMTPLVSAGVSSIVMSLEVWDERLRREVCLGKGEIARDHYFESWDWVLERLGNGMVASVLIAGLEPPESTIDGALTLISRGVIPTVIPFRAYDNMAGSPSNFALTASDLLEIQSHVGAALKAAGLSPTAQPGCTECGGCSMESLGVPVELAVSRVG